MSRRTIVLTGATRGLGRALAEGFAAGGHTVLGCGRDPGRVDDLRRRLGAPHDAQAVDVADAAALQRWAHALLAAGHRPDLLINNAAVTTDPAPLWAVPAGEFDRVIDVNIKGVANVLRSFLPAMVGTGRGVVVNLSSGWGRSTDPNVAPYCATKWAIEGLTQALAQELPRGMAAVALNPGIILTDMLRQCFGAAAEDYPLPGAWARSAVPFILGLGPRDNGRALDVPGARLD